MGRRRVGKTALLQHVYKDKKALYLFISRKPEPLLCEEFADQIRTQLGIPIFGEPKRLSEILSILFEYAKQQPLTLILDEFQDINRLNHLREKAIKLEKKLKGYEFEYQGLSLDDLTV